MINGKTIQWILEDGYKKLYPVVKEDTSFECGELLQFATGFSRSKILSQKDVVVNDECYQSFLKLVDRRKNGEPLQYILGEWEFYGLPFFVGSGVLIPRPETELIIDTGLEFLKKQENTEINVLDLCSGTGCIPIALAANFPNGNFFGVELFDQTFGYFEKNIDYNKSTNVTAVKGDFFNLPTVVTDKKFTVITSNPPYIEADEIAKLQKEVLKEPTTALDGGIDGLDFYKALPSICDELLVNTGMVILEIGNTQGVAVADIFKEKGYITKVLKDLSQNDRVVLATKNADVNIIE